MTVQQSQESRRRFVSKVGTGVLGGGLVGLSGCTSGDGGGDGGDGGGDGGGEGGGDGNTSSGSGGSTSGGGEVSLSVGGLFSLSGPYSAIGVDSRDAVEVALQHIEDEGVDVSIDHTFLDTKLDPNTGLRQARQLVESEDVDVLIGTASSAVANAVSNYARQSQTPFMITVSTAEGLTGENCNGYTFRANTHTYQNQKGNAEWAMENLGTTFATMGADYSWGRASVGAFVEVAEQHGGEVVQQVWPKLGATDYSTQIQKVASTDADFLVVRCSGTDAVRSTTQIDSFGLDDQMAIVSNQTSIMAQGAGDAAIGNYGGVPYHATLTSDQTGNDENERFVADYRELGDGSDPSTYSCTSYVGMRFLAKAAVQAGSTESDALVSSLEGLSYDGPKGEMRIRECDHQATNNIWSTQLVSPEVTEYDYPIPEYNAFHEAGSNSRPCEETGCSI